MKSIDQSDIEEALKEKPIVVLNEDDTLGRSECIRKGLAMLIIPKSATKIEKEMILSGYKNCRLLVIERSNELEIPKTKTGVNILEIRC